MREGGGAGVGTQTYNATSRTSTYCKIMRPPFVVSDCIGSFIGEDQVRKHHLVFSANL